ncbi:hypothetical protein BH10ACT1_BH10ACT1_21430 [soil metagenome]
MATADARSLDVQFDRAGSHLTVYLAGDLDVVTAPPLTDQVIEQTDPSAKTVYLDLTEVGYCDSAGLATFIALHHHIAAYGGEFVLFQPRGIVSRVIAVSGVDTFVSVLGRRSETPPATTPAP